MFLKSKREAYNIRAQVNRASLIGVSYLSASRSAPVVQSFLRELQIAAASHLIGGQRKRN